MLESLESRKLFSATPADASALTATAAEATTSLNFTKIKYDKVAQHDFHFTKKAPSYEVNFVMRTSKASPKLF